MAFIAIKAADRIPEQTKLNDRQAALVVRAQLSDAAGGLGTDALGEWPRDTGRSAAAIEWGVEPSIDGGFIGFVEDLVWYAGYVSLPGGDNAWQLLVDDRGLRAADSIEDDMVDDVAIALVREGP